MGQFGGMNQRFGGMMGNPMMGRPMGNPGFNADNMGMMRRQQELMLRQQQLGPQLGGLRGVPVDQGAGLRAQAQARLQQQGGRPMPMARTQGPESLRRLRSTQMGIGSMQPPMNFAQQQGPRQLAMLAARGFR